MDPDRVCNHQWWRGDTPPAVGQPTAPAVLPNDRVGRCRQCVAVADGCYKHGLVFCSIICTSLTQALVLWMLGLLSVMWRRVNWPGYLTWWLKRRHAPCWDSNTRVSTAIQDVCTAQEKYAAKGGKLQSPDVQSHIDCWKHVIRAERVKRTINTHIVSSSPSIYLLPRLEKTATRLKYHFETGH